MPKKTRKEKILAFQRNQLKKTQETSLENVPVETKNSIKPEPVKIKSPFNAKVDAEEKIIRQYFMSDLKKSLLIIGAVFALEFFFYFATMSNYLKIAF